LPTVVNDEFMTKYRNYMVIKGENTMTKFTKILAAVVAASAVLSLAGCGNKDNSTGSSSSSASDSSAVASTAEASTASSAEVSAPATAEADASATAEVSAPATAEAAAFDITRMYGTWALAAINDGTNTMSVAEYAESAGVDAESLMIFVNIDENGYTSSSSQGEATYPYTVTDSGLIFSIDGIDFTVYYDADSDTFAYGFASNDVTYKYVFMRYAADAAGTAQASATIEG
jgi:uncharacterized lipoprotein NlpE involved in copper resistance